jgi:hypothetical protein
MSRYRIINYQASWDLNDHFGIIRLQAENGNWSPIKRIDNPSEFSAIVDLLRNEKPIFHNSNFDRIETLAEETGENE